MGVYRAGIGDGEIRDRVRWGEGHWGYQTIIFFIGFKDISGSPILKVCPGANV